jgi:hypothetical protein
VFTPGFWWGRVGLLFGFSRMDNPEILTTLGTHGMGRRLEKTEGTIKNGQSRDTGNIYFIKHAITKQQNTISSE